MRARDLHSPHRSSRNLRRHQPILRRRQHPRLDLPSPIQDIPTHRRNRRPRTIHRTRPDPRARRTHRMRWSLGSWGLSREAPRDQVSEFGHGTPRSEPHVRPASFCQVSARQVSARDHKPSGRPCLPRTTCVVCVLAGSRVFYLDSNTPGNVPEHSGTFYPLRGDQGETDLPQSP